MVEYIRDYHWTCIRSMFRLYDYFLGVEIMEKHMILLLKTPVISIIVVTVLGLISYPVQTINEIHKIILNLPHIKLIDHLLKPTQEKTP